MTAAVSMENVCKSFGTGRLSVQALRNVSLTVPKGGMIAVAGPSGSGKTTLLNIIGALDAPTSGTVAVNGTALAARSERLLSRYMREHLGFVFQQVNLFNDLTVSENVALPLILNRVAKADRERRICELLERLGMADRASAFPVHLSAGEQQRIALARAVAHRPALVLADEPTANLDSDNARRVIALLRQLHEAENITVILATHDPFVLGLIDDRIVLRDGAIEAV